MSSDTYDYYSGRQGLKLKDTSCKRLSLRIPRTIESTQLHAEAMFHEVTKALLETRPLLLPPNKVMVFMPTLLSELKHCVLFIANAVSSQTKQK